MLQSLESDLFILSQKFDRKETLSSREVPNTYFVLDRNRALKYEITEIRRGFQFRIPFLPARPFQMTIHDAQGQQIARLSKLRGFYFSKMSVIDPQGVTLASVKQRFKFASRLFDVTNADGTKLFQILSGFSEPSTYHISKGGESIGRIHREWGGIVKESFSDADDYAVELSKNISEFERLLCFSAGVLIDMNFFEKND